MIKAAGSIRLKDAVTGDCLLLRSGGLVARLIELWSWWSHAALVLRLPFRDECIYVAEATLPEVELRKAEEKVRHARVAHLFRPAGLDVSTRYCLLRQATEVVACGVRYDVKGLVANAFGHVSADARRYFCSEFVWDMWQRCGIVPKAQKAPRPSDIPKWVEGTLYEVVM